MPTADAFEWPQGQPLFEVMWRSVTESLAGNGIVGNGDMEVTSTANTLEVEVAAGDYFSVATTYTLGAAETHTLTAGDADFDRWDTVWFDTGTGASGVTEGTPAADPEPPDVSGDQQPLAFVYVAQSASDISDTEILNWRATFSNEAEEVHYDDLEGFFSANNVEEALDSVNDLLVRRNYPTNSGALVLTDMPVDDAPAAGTEQSYTWAIDGTDLLKLYAEADGAGGLQNLSLRALQLLRATAGLEVTGDVSTTGDIATGSGTTIWDSASGETNPAVRSDLGQENLTADEGATTVWDFAQGLVPREQVDRNLLTNAITSNYTTTGEELILADSSGGALTLTLASADAENGAGVQVVDVGGLAGDNPITVATEGSETIDGATSFVVESEYGGVAVRSDGNNWFTAGGGTGSGAGLTANSFAPSASGSVPAGESGVVHISALADGETVNILQGHLTLATGEPVPTGADLVLTTLDNAGGATKLETIVTGDGSTVYDDVSGDPVVSYSNTSGGKETIAILVDNGNFNSGTGASQDISAGCVGVVE